MILFIVIPFLFMIISIYLVGHLVRMFKKRETTENC